MQFSTFEFQQKECHVSEISMKADLISFHDLEVKFEGPESNKAFALKEKKWQDYIGKLQCPFE